MRPSRPPTPSTRSFPDTAALPASFVADLAKALETELSANPHYRLCVALQQLAPARVALIEKDGVSRYLEHCRGRGQRLGDIKPLALSAVGGWGRVFGRGGGRHDHPPQVGSGAESALTPGPSPSSPRAPAGRGETRTPPSQPRALPWAKIFWPFRPEKQAQSRVRLQG